MWYERLKRTHVLCHALCSSRQFVNSGGTTGYTLGPDGELRSSSTGFPAVASSSSRLRLEDTAARIVDTARQPSALHCLGDVEEMSPHRPLGLVFVPGGHRLDDRSVLGHGRTRTPGDE